MSELHVVLHARPYILYSIITLLGTNQCYSHVRSLEQSIVEYLSFQLESCIDRFRELDGVDEGRHLVSRSDPHVLCDDSPSYPNQLLLLETWIALCSVPELRLVLEAYSLPFLHQLLS